MCVYTYVALTEILCAVPSSAFCFVILSLQLQPSPPTLSCNHPHPPFSLPSFPVLIAIESVSHFIVFPTVSDPMNCSPPGSSDHGIVQTRLLECVAIPFSGGSS